VELAEALDPVCSPTLRSEDDELQDDDEDVSAPLEEPATLSLRELEEEACHELDEVVTIHDELDSLTAQLSPLTGAALFSSPQATNPTATKINK
jgi:hypothetical protein